MAAAGPSEPPMVEQVITEFFAKSLHIVLESRSPYDSSRNFMRPSPPPSPLSASQPRDRWFNLALRDCPAALENFDLWRQSNLEPLVIDIVLLQRDNTKTISAGGGRIIERWVIKYETSRSSSGCGNSSKNDGKKSRNRSAEDHSLYRRTYSGATVLLRSLYLVVRLLPAYNLFQELNSSGRIRPLSLSHKISSFVEPFTRAEDADMKHYAFAPIETLFGHLSLSVSYVPVPDVVAAPEPSTPMPPELIMDYVGSPTTDFLRKFNSLPSDGIAPASFPMTRRHSWSNENGAGPSASPFPMNSEPRGRLQPHILMPDNSPTAYSHPHTTSSSGKRKNTVSEECCPSPPLSPSPSHLPSPSYPRNPLFRYESAPLSIPTVRAGAGGSGLPPSPCRKDKQQCSSQNENQTHSPNDKSVVAKDLVRLGEFQNDKSLQKVLSFGKYELGYFRGLKLTRTSSKLFIMDELDERELAFAWEDKDTIIDQLNRIDISDREDHESNQDLGGSLTRSPDAAIGILVRMLKNAPGLRERLLSIPAAPVPQEPSSLQRVVTEERDSGASSSAAAHSFMLRSRTAADALEELNRYKEIREMILNRGKGHPCDSKLEEKPTDGDP
ncbi:autophagy-related protein 13b-like isoform X2 [Phragmites australis]|uniref:autophagy-related protein 13b-like isoform X2 n=1 Tax=Phragmites australis TaxID=29695 RepID=UPI002D767FFC|nr:autophagy-related protein 13b-like isoform X2 [Phragmites australis]